MHIAKNTVSIIQYQPHFLKEDFLSKFADIDNYLCKAVFTLENRFYF